MRTHFFRRLFLFFMTYQEKLRDPRWQRKRLEVLSRDNFTCCFCTDQETELHVHHLSYEKGKEPWEYDISNFETLCKDCHSIIESIKKSGLIIINRENGFTSREEIVLLRFVLIDPETNKLFFKERYKNLLTKEVTFSYVLIGKEILYLFEKYNSFKHKENG